MSAAYRAMVLDGGDEPIAFGECRNTLAAARIDLEILACETAIQAWPNITNGHLDTLRRACLRMLDGERQGTYLPLPAGCTGSELRYRIRQVVA